jgi:glycosyltransferase involved in cell wall biosynthesis
MRPLNILHVNTMDHGGGAAQLSFNLLEGCNAAGHQAWLAVLKPTRLDPRVYAIANGEHRHPWARLCNSLLRPIAGNRIARAFGRPLSSARVFLGHEDFDFPGSRHLLEDAPVQPDLIHLHNLHGSFFDLSALPELSSRIPTFLTMHDAWLTSGHCSHSFDCDRWRTGCGACPDLTTYPAIRQDATAYNWRRKRSIYAQSRLHIAVPCRWLLDKLQASMLAPAVASVRIIHHGIDLKVFQPGDRAAARRELGWPAEADILLFAAKGIRGNVAKDYRTMLRALEILGARPAAKPLIFIALGDEAPVERIGNAELRFVPHLSDRAAVARHYQAADIYVHAARAEVWGLSITEAMACGLPVVASEVGGIPDQVANGQGGFLAPVGDGFVMAGLIGQLIGDCRLRAEMGRRAQARAQAEFGVERMTRNYLDWYESVLDSHGSGRTANTPIMSSL